MKVLEENLNNEIDDLKKVIKGRVKNVNFPSWRIDMCLSKLVNKIEKKKNQSKYKNNTSITISVIFKILFYCVFV